MSVVAAPSAETPDQTVQIWPWRFEEDRNFTLHKDEAPKLPPAKISCLVLAPDLATLEQVRAGVFQHAVVVQGGQRITVAFEPLGATEYLKLFLAAKTVPRPCLNYLVRAVVA